jgi:thiosulfate/3-mercaptopyruvate sulfurtransferase
MYTTLISTADLAERLDAPGLVLIDVRHELSQPDWGEAQYRAGHLPGAIFLHLDRDLSAPKTGTNGRHPLLAPEAYAKVFGRAGIDDTTEVIAYDQNQGTYAARLWWMLRWLGHDAVAVLDGGFDKWRREAHPVSTEVPRLPVRKFIPRPRRITVDAAGVQANLDTKALLVVDARGAERFRGDVEPLDPVAGHIPGAVNRPFTKNLSTDGTFKAPAALRAEYLAMLQGRSADTIVHQCGSGVTACHNLLAMEIAGLKGARLYAGSWSEWIADPARPRERG